MRKFLVLFLAQSFVITCVVGNSFAGLIDYNRLQKQGKALPTGGRAKAKAAAPTAPTQDTRPGWMKTEPKVTSKVEQPYDSNNDGKLQTAEVKIFLRDVLDQINEKGGYTINSDILKEYDKNKDGVISRYEAQDITNTVR